MRDESQRSGVDVPATLLLRVAPSGEQAGTNGQIVMSCAPVSVPDRASRPLNGRSER